jgi:hypothetical protein
MTDSAMPDWLSQFGADAAAGQAAAILATTGSDGWPHLAYLSMGEVLAYPGGVSLGLWPGSQTSANIRRDGRAVLHAAFAGAVWEARLKLRLRDAAGALALFDGEIVATRRHEAPYADVLGLVAFRLHDADAAHARWAAQRAALMPRA